MRIIDDTTDYDGISVEVDNDKLPRFMELKRKLDNKLANMSEYSEFTIMVWKGCPIKVLENSVAAFKENIKNAKDEKEKRGWFSMKNEAESVLYIRKHSEEFALIKEEDIPKNKCQLERPTPTPTVDDFLRELKKIDEEDKRRAKMKIVD
jgi:hypothetical protein